MDILQDITQKSFDNKEELRSEFERALSGPALERDEPVGFQGEGVYFGQVPPKMRTDQYLQAATSWVYGAVTRIADAVASTNLCLYEIKGKGEVEKIEDHKALDVLDHINSFTTRLDHFWLTQQYLELTGEAPWYISRGESGEKEPDNILLLRPDKLQIVQSDDPNSESPIKEFKYRADARNEITIKESELLFLKYPDPINMFRGKGTLQAAAKTVDIDNFSEDYNKRFFYNSARPDSILTTPNKLTSAQRQQLRGDIRKLYQGGDKAHKTAILESGLDWKPMSLSPKDMEFLAQQTFDMAKIFSLFGVPKSVMSISDDVNLANAKIGEYLFAKYTVLPKLKRIAGQLNEFYLPMFTGTEKMFFAFDDPVSQDIDSDVKRFDSALSKGYMTINEVRNELNLPDIGEEGDKLLVPNSLVPVDQAGQSPLALYGMPGQRVNGPKIKLLNSSLVDRSAGGYRRALGRIQAKERVQQKQDEAKEKIEKVATQIDQIAYAMVKHIVKSKKVAAKKAEGDRKDKFANYGKVFVKAVRNYERAFTIGTQVIFREQKKKVLASAPQKALKAAGEFDDWLLDEEAETETMVRVYSPTMRQMLKEQGTRAAALVGETFDMASKPVQDYLKERTFEFSFEVNEETNRLLSATLQEGVAAGEAVPKLRDRVADLFDNMEQYRAERIARSEVVRGSNFAADEAYKQSGVVEQVQWLTTEDDRTDEECASLDGKIIDLGENFFDKGDTIGKLTLDYGDVEYPPLHPNCRCTIVPITSN